VFRIEKKRFFKAIVKEIDNTCTPIKILFHFMKTSSNVDEWIEHGSDRIRPYKSAVPVTATKEQKRRTLEKQAAKSKISTTVTIDSTMSSTADEAGPAFIGHVPLVSVEQRIAERIEPASNSTSCGTEVPDGFELNAQSVSSQSLHAEQASSPAHSDVTAYTGRQDSFQLPLPPKSASCKLAVESLVHRNESPRCHSAASNHFLQPAVPFSSEMKASVPLGGSEVNAQINYDQETGVQRQSPASTPRHFNDSDIGHQYQPTMYRPQPQQVDPYHESAQPPSQQQQPTLSSPYHVNDPQINHHPPYQEQHPPLSSSPHRFVDPQISHYQASNHFDYAQQQPPVSTPHHFSLPSYHQSLPTGSEALVQQQRTCHGIPSLAPSMGMPNHPTNAASCQQQLGHTTAAAPTAPIEVQYHQWPQQGDSASVPNSHESQPQNHHNSSWPQQQQPLQQQQQLLSGLDVLALLTERLEVVCEQQPNMSPEQALHQFVRSQGLQFLFRR
jgi:hypothetical protein